MRKLVMESSRVEDSSALKVSGLSPTGWASGRGVRRRDEKRPYLAWRLVLRVHLRGSDFSEKLPRVTTDERN